MDVFLNAVVPQSREVDVLFKVGVLSNEVVPHRSYVLFTVDVFFKRGCAPQQREGGVFLNAVVPSQQRN